ncbi:hypothetical protein D041_0324 [Vibrio parahaemolyticus EKP-008]|nr:hypothetical protein D041_0324 [Vibrio parahaemolyticus EKP-008]
MDWALVTRRFFFSVWASVQSHFRVIKQFTAFTAQRIFGSMMIMAIHLHHRFDGFKFGGEFAK